MLEGFEFNQLAINNGTIKSYNECNNHHQEDLWNEKFVEKIVTGMPKKNDTNGQWKNHKESVIATSSECGRHLNILISGWEGRVEVAIKSKYRIISAALE